MDSLKLSARALKGGCGIYQVGNTDKCCVKLFVTDGGRVMPVSHRVISEDDLIEVYNWGRIEASEGITGDIEPPAEEFYGSEYDYDEEYHGN